MQQQQDQSDAAAVKAFGDWQLHQACRIPVSFRALAMSSTSRAAIAAASGISSLQRKGVLIKAAGATGLTGLITV